jgi:hypothetical protein
MNPLGSPVTNKYCSATLDQSRFQVAASITATMEIRYDAKRAPSPQPPGKSHFE